jgi:hypothetical protein
MSGNGPLSRHLSGINVDFAEQPGPNLGRRFSAAAFIRQEDGTRGTEDDLFLLVKISIPREQSPVNSFVWQSAYCACETRDSIIHRPDVI